jgi:hypothetical protein
VKVRVVHTDLGLHLTASFCDQVTRKTKRVLQKSMVDHNVAERKTWAKFGLEKGSKPGPDRATTTVGEFVGLKISAGKQVSHPPTAFVASD